MKLRGLLLAAVACGLALAGALAVLLPGPSHERSAATAAADPLGRGPAAAAADPSTLTVAAGWPQKRTLQADGPPRIVAREPNPGGGPEWAVRVFPARQTWRERGGGRTFGGPMGCAQLGRVYDGRFGWVDGANVFRPVEPGLGGAPTNCSALPSSAWPLRLSERITRISDPAGGKVRELGTVLWSVLDSDPRRARVRLVVGEAARQRGARVEYRVPDPGGGLPWGIAATAAGGEPPCLSMVGRVVGDHVGNVDYRLGTLSEMAGADERRCSTSPSGGPPVTRSRPLALMAYSIPAPDADPALASRRVARRTLVGQTTIVGLAHRDVMSVTLVSPRDVRTLTPSPREHAFAAVYDGGFPTGRIDVVARMRDGTTVRQAAGPFRP